jgi:hypothetical protein
MKSEQYTLEIGRRTLVPTKKTLTIGMLESSKFFESQFAFERKKQSDHEETAYRLNLDPDLFTHIMDYLRSGVIPLL